MEKEYTYSAFISYSSKDKKVAKALWKKLERYRLPAVLQKQYEEVPEKMHVFLDQGDIAPGGTVEKALCRELADSKKLIVICSPNSAVSPYVELEVQNFLALGHTMDDIIPYIIAGEVKKGNANNCYVPSLFGETDKDTANGVSVLRDGKLRAFSGVLSNILGVKFDEVYQREKRRRNQLIAAYSALGTLAACFLAVLVWYVTPHTKCYNDYITKWGIPIGIGKAHVRLSSTYYEITYQYGRPIKLVHKDFWGRIASHGTGNEQQNRPKIAEYTYENAYVPFLNMKDWHLSKVNCRIDPNTDTTGNISKVTHDQNMQMIYEWTDENTANISFYYDVANSVPKTLSNDVLSYQNIYYDDIPNLLIGIFDNDDKDAMPDIQIFLNSSNIYRHKVIYDEQGFEKTISFYNYAGQSASDKNGIHGFIKYYNDYGQVIKEEYQYDDISTERLYKVICYDSYHEVNKIAFYKNEQSASSDKKVLYALNPSRNYAYMERVTEYDTKKRYIEDSYFDEKSVPICDSEFGVKAITTIIDDKENTVFLKLLQADGEYIHSIRYEKNKKGISEIRYLWGEEFTDYISSTTNYDYEGKEIKCSYKTTKDVTEDIERQNYTVSYKKNSDDNLLIQYVYNSGDIRTWTYDKYGRHIEDTLVMPDNTAVTVTLVYDGFGKHIYYHLNGELTSNITGFAQADFSYHSTGVLQNAVYRDEKGKKANHHYTYTFAEYNANISPHGFVRHAEFKDKEGNIVVSDYHNYAIFDGDSGAKDLFMVEGRYLMPDGSRAENVRWWFKEDTYPFPESFDEPIIHAVRYFDSEEKTQAWHIYDITGDEKYRCYYDDKHGIYIYDDKRQLIRFEQRDAEGHFKNMPGEAYAIIHYTYSNSGEEVRDFISEDNELRSKIYCDVFGNTKKYISYKEDGRIFHAVYEKNIKEYSYTSKDGILEEKTTQFFNDDGSYIQFDEYYNNSRLLGSDCYYDKDGNLRLNEEGWAKIIKGKTENGFYIEMFYDENDTLLPYKSNYVCTVTEVTSSANDYDIQIGDIILELSTFSYFDGSSLIFPPYTNNDELAIFYRPSDAQIRSFPYDGSWFISVSASYPCKTIKESTAYISQIKSAYDAWLASSD